MMIAYVPPHLLPKDFKVEVIDGAALGPASLKIQISTTDKI